MIVLSAGNLELNIVPECGAISAFRMKTQRDTFDLLRPASADAISRHEPLGMGCFPLVPYSGAVWDGHFSFEERIIALKKTHPNEPYPIHGDGWINPWQIRSSKQNSAILEYEHSGASGFPFAYLARQEFLLDGTGLSVKISLTNSSGRMMPCGIGFHPYFPKIKDCVLTTDNPLVWPDMEKTGQSPAKTPADWDFSQGRCPENLVLDHCFANWNHHAKIHWPKSAIELSIRSDSPLDSLVIFIPRGENYFCVEPVSNADDGFNRMHAQTNLHGVKVLAPGETLTGTIRLDPVKL